MLVSKRVKSQWPHKFHYATREGACLKIEYFTYHILKFANIVTSIFIFEYYNFSEIIILLLELFLKIANI